ncbi:hypothetical protein AB0392_50585 [Nonomuraea angiospora]|uniref:hypothetical protein n=1 Tax=Nonomuraea angiospora TaxID=46172 RepID=UPI003450B4A6
MSPARPAHEQPGAIPASVPYDEYGGIIQDPASVDPDSIDWRKPTPFPALLRLHHTNGLRGSARHVTWRDVYSPATYPMFADDLPHTIRGTVIDHGVIASAVWVPITRRGRYGISLKTFHEQEEHLPAPAPASPAEESAARYIDREHVVQLIRDTFSMGEPEEDLPPDLKTLIRHIREDHQQ